MSNKPDKWERKYDALLETILTHPDWSDYQLGQEVGYSRQWVCQIKNSALFQERYRQAREERLKELEGLSLKATEEAVKHDLKVIGDEKVSLEGKQKSLDRIYSLGLAKAIDKKAILSANANIPESAIENLIEGLKDIDKPFVPSRRLKQPDRDLADLEKERNQ